MDTFDLLVVFKDGSKLIVDVKGTYSNTDKGYFRIDTKNDGHICLNWNEVKYCGHLSDLR